MAATVTVNGNTIDSAAGDHTYRDASGSDFIYIKAHDVLTNDQKQGMTEHIMLSFLVQGCFPLGIFYATT